MFSCGLQAMERIDDLSEPQPPAEGAPSEMVERLRVAYQPLGQADTRLAAAKRINAVLASLTKTSSVDERPAVAKAVLQLLDEPTFKAAFDVDGVSCRVSAVGLLLELGYPWALQLHPDDLAFYRQKAQGGARGRRWLIAGAIALIAAGLGFLARDVTTGVKVPPPPIVAPKQVKTAPVIVPSRTFTEEAQVTPLQPVAAASRAFMRSPSAVTVRFPRSGPATRIPLQYTELPEAEAALQALETEDFAQAFEQITRCVARYQHPEACQVLKIIALRMRNTMYDEARATAELQRLRSRDPRNVSLPSLQALGRTSK